VIDRAVLCPATPLLVRPLSGREPVLADLRSACAAAVEWLLTPRPPAVVIVAPGPETASVDPAHGLDLSRYSPGMARGSAVSTGIGLAGMLLDEAGWDGPRRAWTVAGSELDLDDAVLLVMGDGSAARLLSPGEDERAESFDAAVEAALRTGDLGSLDGQLADELAVTGWPAWQVLAAAMGSGWSGDVRYSAAPLGVRYYVATVTRGGGLGGSSL
jgi:hypothetical protein